MARPLMIQKTWLRFCVGLLSLYYVVTYLDPDLPQGLENTGIWGHGWSIETIRYIPINVSAYFGSNFVSILILLGLAGALLLNSSKWRTSGVIVTMVVQSIVALRNPLSYVIHRPFIGLVTAFLPFIVENVDRRYFRFRAIDWLWSASAVCYLASAVSKLREEHWQRGTALADFVGFPMRSLILAKMIESSLVLGMLTYGVILIELIYGVLAYFRIFHAFCWAIILFLHIGIVSLLHIPIASIPMIIFHLFLFEVSWLDRFPFLGSRSRSSEKAQ